MKDFELGSGFPFFRSQSGEHRRPKTPHKPFGIMKKDLENIGDLKKGYYLLECIYGLHNLDIPLEMLEVMNPDEILAKYLAAGALKRSNNHKRAPTEDFMNLIREMDDFAYPLIGSVAGSFERRFPSAPDEQKRRLEGLDADVKNSLMISFFSDYRPSKKEFPTCPYAFPDPNVDGRNKGLYIDGIYKRLLRLDAKYTQFPENDR